MWAECRCLRNNFINKWRESTMMESLVSKLISAKRWIRPVERMMSPGPINNDSPAMRQEPFTGMPDWSCLNSTGKVSELAKSSNLSFAIANTAELIIWAVGPLKCLCLGSKLNIKQIHCCNFVKLLYFSQKNTGSDHFQILVRAGFELPMVSSTEFFERI